jgi:hypothetical protein
MFNLQLVADVMEALVNMGDVMAELWPLDDTPRVLTRILVHYKFAAGIRDGEADRCKIISEFCDSVLRENASRAVGRLPPLSFRQAKERWGDVAERYGTAGSNRGGKADGRGQQSSGTGGGTAGGAGQQRGGGMLAKSRSARFQYNGKQYGVCFKYIRNNCNRKQSGCGCEERNIMYAHVCNYFIHGQNRHCLAQHPRLGNH